MLGSVFYHNFEPTGRNFVRNWESWRRDCPNNIFVLRLLNETIRKVIMIIIVFVKIFVFITFVFFIFFVIRLWATVEIRKSSEVRHTNLLYFRSDVRRYRRLKVVRAVVDGSGERESGRRSSYRYKRVFWRLRTDGDVGYELHLVWVRVVDVFVTPVDGRLTGAVKLAVIWRRLLAKTWKFI